MISYMNYHIKICHRNSKLNIFPRLIIAPPTLIAPHHTNPGDLLNRIPRTISNRNPDQAITIFPSHIIKFSKRSIKTYGCHILGWLDGSSRNQIKFVANFNNNKNARVLLSAILPDLWRESVGSLASVYCEMWYSVAISRSGINHFYSEGLSSLDLQTNVYGGRAFGVFD